MLSRAALRSSPRRIALLLVVATGLVVAQVPGLLLLRWIPAAVSADPIVDQQQLLASATTFMVSTVQRVAQTLTLGRNGRLAELQLDVGCGGSGTGSLVIEVRDLRPDGTPGGDLRASTSVPGAAVPDGDGLSFFVFRFASDAPVFQAGDRVSIEAFTTAEDTLCVWGASLAEYNGDAYPAGAAWTSYTWCASGCWSAWADDLRFKWRVEPPADLAVQLLDAPDPAVAGYEFAYTMTARNLGPDSAGADMSLSLATGVSVVTADSRCSATDRTVTCSLGELAAGESRVRSVTVRSQVPGSFEATASISGSLDPAPANNTATTTTTVRRPISDVYVEIEDAPDPVVVGDLLTYSLRVGSLGPENALDVGVRLSLPAEVDFVEARAPCVYVADRHTVSCQVGSLESQRSVFLFATVRPRLATTITASATVLALVTDGVSGNDGAAALTSVQDPPPGTTPPGTTVTVEPVDPVTGTSPVTLTFDSVTEGGTTTVTTSGTGTPPPSGFRLGSPPTYFEISTTATTSGPTEVCISYAGVQYGNENNIRLFHYEDSNGDGSLDAWVDRTSSLDTTADVVCATVPSLSPFVLAETAFDFTGFLRPIATPPSVNVVRAGAAVPIKFSLGGDKGLGIMAAGYPSSVAVSCLSGVPAESVEETVTAGSSSLTYDPTSDQYVYVWKTDKAWAGQCRQLTVRLSDGSEQRADFRFER